MPYPNEHSARVAEPLTQNSGIFARKPIAPGISLITQKPKGDPGASMKAQAYRFGKHQFTPEEAKAWLKKHDISYILFEPARDTGDKETRKEIINRVTKELSGAIIA